MSVVAADGTELTRVGADLQRPECILTTACGDLYTSDRRGVVHTRADGSTTLYTGRSADIDGALAPNGIAMEPDGSFLVAHLGPAQGGIFRLHRDGALEPHLQEVDGTALPPTNFVIRDGAGRVWVTVSTRAIPRDLDYRPDAADGFIVLADDRGTRIVADGLGFTNECAPSADGRWLYANETFTRRLSRFPIRRDGSLGEKEVVAEFGPGDFPDGLALDVDGNVWVACVVGNTILRVDPAGRVTTWIDAGVPEHVAALEDAYLGRSLTTKHMTGAGGSPLGNCSTVAFGGPEHRTAYVGSLVNDHVLRFEAPAAGVEPPHWRFEA